jgi:ribosomal protein S18 acetylase RimI-like enzyme
MCAPGPLRIRALSPGDDLAACAALLRESFGTVAAEFGLTAENAPTNAAFTTAENLLAHLRDGMELFGGFAGARMAGCVAVKASKPGHGIHYVERLAVATAERHRGYGGTLLSFAVEMIRARGGTTVSIGLIDDNDRLKRWYLSKGFAVRERRRVPSLPFRVCVMSLELERPAAR